MSHNHDDRIDDTDTSIDTEDTPQKSDGDPIQSEPETPASEPNPTITDPTAADSPRTERDTQADGPAPKGPDEVYCTSCGEPIKEQAEICPHCGVRQAPVETNETSTQTQPQSQNTVTQTPEGTGDLPQARIYELQKVARKDITTVVIVSLLLTPAGYWMVGKTGLAIINFLTFNYFLLGFIIVPLHTRKIIKDARDELNRNNVGW